MAVIVGEVWFATKMRHDRFFVGPDGHGVNSQCTVHGGGELRSVCVPFTGW